MDSQTHDAQRVEGSAESRHSIEVSQSLSRLAPTHTASTHRTQRQESRSRSKEIKELRQLGAEDFKGTTDPAEAEAWLKRIERLFTLLGSTEEQQFYLVISLLQGDAYDWWETIPNATARPPVLTYADFLKEFKDRYMPEMYRDEKQREFLNLKQRNMTVAEYEV